MNLLLFMIGIELQKGYYESSLQKICSYKTRFIFEIILIRLIFFTVYYTFPLQNIKDFF